jgi:plasmid stabilization system protein ParE
MILETLLAANEEIEHGFLYYETQVPGLGFQFLDALEEAYRRILSNPEAWTLPPNTRGHRFHRCLLKRFPYGLIYSIKERRIIILAVMHLARKPGYWRKRRSR